MRDFFHGNRSGKQSGDTERKDFYGILIGIVTIIIRSFSGFVEGMMFAILFGNICAPLIDEVVVRSRIRRYVREGEY
ncbi:MAG: hypothetical protein DRP54_01675 [Spirochaetes bacterium]|nr:MAG: hypothetical protein DRP54_01675 [Spirochaetota bacterium]